MNDIDNNLNFTRAMNLLESADTPAKLFTFWRACGTLPLSSDVPTIEKCSPWWNNLEELIK